MILSYFDSVRVASLAPSATEFLFALGLGDEVVAVTHECDHPLDVLALPQLTHATLEPGLTPAEVDAAVQERIDAGEALHELDEELLVEVEPDLIFTQSPRAACSVPHEDVIALAERLDSRPRVVALDATTIGEVLGSIRTISQAAECKDAGVDLLRELADRLDAVKIALRGVGRDDGPPPPTVLALEWLDPPFTSGLWIPQMIELAGGFDPFGLPGEPSEPSEWKRLATAEPDAVVLAQCGYSASLSAEEAEDHASQLLALGASQIFAADASNHFSRPGPRLIDGLEQLAHALHPDLVPEPHSGTLLPVELR